ncbi:MAG: class I SAM-dependent rRNA methyltransferase [Candidatus Aminicenantales bacterium]
MTEPAVILKKNKDKAIRQRHHWIFSGAVQNLPDFEDGDILPVKSSDGELLGHAYFNRQCAIIGRILSFGRMPPLEAIEKNLAAATALRKKLVEPDTNAYRLVNGEGDGLPGLVVDRYDDVLVVQIATRGMEKLKPVILDRLIKILAPRSIYEKSSLPTRREEGLPEFEGPLYGEEVKDVTVHEDGSRFLVEITGSQKTGFFLDLREMRRLVRSTAQGRKVLNAFCYTGAFSVAALAGGAVSVHSVDSSRPAIELAKRNLALNGFSDERNRFEITDVFDFLRRQTPPYDFIILDPPAFAKKKSDIVPACRGYKDINRQAFQKIMPKGLLLTFSCSYFVDERLFRQVVFQAASEAGREARIIQKHRLAFDHPVNVYHPESEYLKSLLLYVE